jgi:hypothetical protein
LAIARLFSGPARLRDLTFHIADRQALTSLITFNLGAFFGRIGDHPALGGPKSRLWLVVGTFFQALFTMSASLAVWGSGQGSLANSRGTPAWTNTLTYVALGFMSASLGLQGVMAKKLKTQFTTTSKHAYFLFSFVPCIKLTLPVFFSVVLTTVWCDLMSDPNLFNFRHYVITRDHKLIAAGSIFLGGFIGRALLDKIGGAGTLGVGAGFRFCIALGWIFVPGTKV